MVTRRSFRTGAIVLSSLLALVVAELVVRNYFPRRTIEVLSGFYPAMFTESEHLPYRLRPNYSGRLTQGEFDTGIHINALGYRGDDFAAAKGDALRILVAGDSFTFGWGVNDQETYPARLQQRLGQAFPGRRTEVINAGFAACYSPDTYYLYLKREGLPLRPDAVVVGLYVGNDLDNAMAFENEWTEVDAEGLPLRIRNKETHVVGNLYMPRYVPFRYRVPVLSRLHLFQAVADVWWELKPRLMTTLYAAADVPYIYRHSYEERTTTVLTRVKTLLKATNTIALQAGVPLYVMLIPEDLQMTPETFDASAAEIDKPQRLLKEFFEAEKIRYLDLLPWLREHAAGRQIYFPGDRHWNALGHDLAAEALAEFLATEIAKKGSGPEK
jgi:lysophospholipase L1-like esterase